MKTATEVQLTKSQARLISQKLEKRLLNMWSKQAAILIGQLMTYTKPKQCNFQEHCVYKFKPGDVVRITPPKYRGMCAPVVEKLKKKCIGLVGVIKRRSVCNGGLVYLEMDEPHKVPEYFMKNRKWLCWREDSVTKDTVGYMKHVRRPKKTQ